MCKTAKRIEPLLVAWHRPTHWSGHRTSQPPSQPLYKVSCRQHGQQPWLHLNKHSKHSINDGLLAVEESDEASADDQDDDDDEDFGSKPRAPSSAGRSSRPSSARASAVSLSFSCSPAMPD